MGGVIALFLYSFYPEFLAHGKLVNTDVPAALGFVLVLYLYWRFIRSLSFRNAILLGVGMGVGVLLKQSVLLPIAVILLVSSFSVLVKFMWRSVSEFFKEAGLTCFSLLVALIVIYGMYAFASLNYPREDLMLHVNVFMDEWNVTLPDIIWSGLDSTFWRPLGLFVVGVFREIRRSESYGLRYFMGSYSNDGWWYFFPVLYFYKSPAVFHFLTGFGLWGLVHKYKYKFMKHPQEKFVPFFIIALTIIWYTFIAMSSTLNIGFRHLLPVIPLVMILIAVGLRDLIYTQKKIVKSIFAVLAILTVWVAVFEFPYYLSYYNVFSGGTKNGYTISQDSDYFWDQEYKRLGEWIASNNIDHMYVDCGASKERILSYYGKDSIVMFPGSSTWAHSGLIEPITNLPKGEFLAICATTLYEAYFIWETDTWVLTENYPTLRVREPDFRVGMSMFVFRM
ncbi:hypothetical protein GW793_01385 [bacterium]|uniref:Uncharacterized protein n=2 Tax=Katanobacteria TaxID=422282 RepID=A0A2M7X342_UNCKA|nr:hypothetical protein [bacterium]PIP56929.1 MAG: hypothetical protein COX05_00615 [candidate division WWE3 bacterium CG22_combo_CG10-13_8_21_14_all_39_12]PJA40539.1 MAG: hypothetical protein CO179_01995 [candidate division WWE3 bacterium CG_4_9_14_3_um_filter_39_7]